MLIYMISIDVFGRDKGANTKLGDMCYFLTIHIYVCVCVALLHDVVKIIAITRLQLFEKSKR